MPMLVVDGGQSPPYEHIQTPEYILTLPGLEPALGIPLQAALGKLNLLAHQLGKHHPLHGANRMVLLG
jgi:hypothetical protein